MKITFEIDDESAALLWWDTWCDAKRSVTDIAKGLVEQRVARVRNLHASETTQAVERFKSDYTPTADEAG